MSAAAAPVRWGVLGATSWVATDAVLPAIAASPTAELAAVASRDGAAAEAVAARFGAARAYGAYAELLDDPAVEAVYIPLPNALHADWTARCAAAGKHVLCEKPLAVDLAQARSMVDACAAAGVHLLEAYMTPFHPRSEAILEILRGDELGEVLRIDSVFTFPLDDPGNHRWLPEMGGGALLDVGVYVLAPLLAIDTEPSVRAAAAGMSDGGVDATTSARLELRRGGTVAIADILCSFVAPELQQLEVVGTRASLHVERPFTPGPQNTELVLRRGRRQPQVRRTAGADPYLVMVEHCAEVFRGRTPPRRPAAEILASMALIDRVAAATRDAVAVPSGR